MKLRKIEIKGASLNVFEGWFHGWTRTCGEMRAVVEDEDGRISYESPDHIKFLKQPEVL